MSENLAEHYALSTSQQVEDEVTYQTGPAQIGPASGQAKPGAGKAIAGELHQG